MYTETTNCPNLQADIQPSPLFGVLPTWKPFTEKAVTKVKIQSAVATYCVLIYKSK